MFGKFDENASSCSLLSKSYKTKDKVCKNKALLGFGGFIACLLGPNHAKSYIKQ